MPRAYYRAGFEKQLTGSALSGTNCGAASGAMLADQATLGLTDPTPDAFRFLTGDMVGGLNMGNVADAMERLGVPVMVFDHQDRLKWGQLQMYLDSGHFALVAGDYETLPPHLKGDKDFDGAHSVFWWRSFTRVQIVGDPLNDGRRPGIPEGYIKWPNDEAYQYVRKFDGDTAGGIYAVVMVKRMVTPRAWRESPVKVRRHQRMDAEVIGLLPEGRKLVTGGTKEGEEVQGNRRWFKVWHPKAASVGFIPHHVVKRA